MKNTKKVVMLAISICIMISANMAIAAPASNFAQQINPTVPGSGSGSGSSGGSGFGIGGIHNSKMTFKGLAYPNQRVMLLQDGQIIDQTTADVQSKFTMETTGMSAGSYQFALYAIDKMGVRSVMMIFPVNVTPGSKFTVENIIIPPTIVADKQMTIAGTNIEFFGQSVQNSNIEITVNGTQKMTQTDALGIYNFELETANLENGPYQSFDRVSTGGRESSYSDTIRFDIGEYVIENTNISCPQRGDLNNDCRVNLIDFSIAAFWYHKQTTGPFKIIEQEELNGDAYIDIMDFSIMAYYWTG